MLILRPIQPEDADLLFPMIYHSPVADTLLWDGPASLEEYRQGMSRRTEQTARGEGHMMTIVLVDDLQVEPPVPIGSVDIRPEPDQNLRADIGLWIGLPYHGKGYGTLTIRWMVDYGFIKLSLEKIEASVYSGNWASRRIFEKNGFILEGTIRKASLKRGEWQDDWRMGLTREDYKKFLLERPIYHITTQAAWGNAQSSGSLAPASLTEVGFIHCSRLEQILWVVNSKFRGEPNLVLLEIAPRLVQPEMRWEASENSYFPHIYGPLNIDSVTGAKPISPDMDGFFRKMDC